MSTIHELQVVLDDTAEDLAQVLPEVDNWGGALVYLLQALEVKAMDLDQEHPAQFEVLLSDLAGAIASRLNAGRW